MMAIHAFVRGSEGTWTKNCISPCFGLFMMVFALSGGLDPATTVALLGS